MYVNHGVSRLCPKSLLLYNLAGHGVASRNIFGT